ncbi:alanine--tRNA ligase, partial [Patescibacteria group bacterium]|nr:alanine--tRNA ligase [Patescibacteria group bacterium]
DEESIKHWEENFAKHNIKAGVAGADEKISGDVRIVPLGTDDNFWIAGNTGPCGPDTEMFYDVVGGKLEGKFHDLVKQGRIIEIWNDVFMEFNKKADGSIEKLAKQNVDTGMGLERTAVVMQQKSTVFETDLFDYLMNAILATPRKALPSNISFETKEEYMRKVRIIADHIRSSVFMIADGVIPSNTEQGYVLRRLIRRAAFNAASIQLQNSLNSFVGIVAEKYKDVYAEIKTKQKHVRNILADEELKFTKTLVEGEKIFNKISTKDISGEDAFKLFSTYGYPLELTVEMANQKGIKVDIAGFQGEFKKHQDISRAGSEQKFKGGLASTGEQETKYHTATHLTLAALQKVLGQAIVQKGSNITAERMRFDFNWPTKLTPEQVKAVEDLVNEKIKEHLPVEMQELPKPEAEKIATTLAFDLSHYGDVVKVYKIGVKDGGYFSIEFCGGPHVKNTGELGHFKIVKEEAVSAGVRRIKAVLE